MHADAVSGAVGDRHAVAELHRLRAVVDNLQEELSGFFVGLHLNMSGNAVRALAACVNRILKRVGEQHAQVALGKRQLIGQHGMHRKRDALRLGAVGKR